MSGMIKSKIMTDKVQKIREEIEKRYEYWKEKEFNSHSIESEIRMSECQHLLLMIDSLQDEPCNRCQGYNNKEECDTLVFGHNCPIVKKPINEDLEEAAKNHAAERYRVTRDRELAEKCKWSFKAGAKWQEKEDQSTIELAEDHAMLAGMEKMKEEMMSKAIDAQCFGFQGAALFSFRLPADNYLVGSEIKVIVIKED